jgi:hypothetical protein
VAIIVAAIIGLYPSLLTLAALLSLPALVLAIRGALRPAYLDPQGVADPRGWYRQYTHICAAVCGGLVAFILLHAAITAQ